MPCSRRTVPDHGNRQRIGSVAEFMEPEPGNSTCAYTGAASGFPKISVPPRFVFGLLALRSSGWKQEHGPFGSHAGDGNVLEAGHCGNVGEPSAPATLSPGHATWSSAVAEVSSGRTTTFCHDSSPPPLGPLCSDRSETSGRSVSGWCSVTVNRTVYVLAGCPRTSEPGPDSCTEVTFGPGPGCPSQSAPSSRGSIPTPIKEKTPSRKRISFLLSVVCERDMTLRDDGYR
jgi:hypothetical protein